MAPTERLILVDGSSLIYRAYYAIPANFSTSQGLPTNAIYGFATMFKKVLSGKTPEYGAVVFDAPGKTFRAEKYPEYKSHRPRMDTELKQQLPWIDKLVHAHHFPLLRVPGYEADDIIATLVEQANAANIEVHIISGDKDFAQLISEQVRMVDTLRDVVYTPELVRKKWGVPPQQFVDWQAMVGDKADNIPGVPGIGAKGAALLLERFSDLETILASTEELKGRQKNNLVEFADQARLSQELATLDRATPLEQSLQDLRLQLPESNALNELYTELEFYSLLSADAAALEQGADDDCTYEVLGATDIEQFVEQLALQEHVAVLPLFDLPSPVTGTLAALAICSKAKHATLLPIAGPDGLGVGVLAHLKPWLENAKKAKLCHNAKELWVCLQRLGIELQGVVGDTILESFLVDPTRLTPHRIDQIVKDVLHTTVPPAKHILGSGKKERRFSELTSEEMREWSGQQVDAVFQCWPKLRERLLRENQRAYLEDIDLPLSWLLGSMELAGILVDPKSLAAMGKEFSTRLAGYESEIFEHAGRTFNIASTKQLSTVLFDEMKLPVIKRTKSGYSTKAEVLEKLAEKHEIAKVLLQHRKLAKLINTYTDVLQREVNPTTGRVHATFQQTVGATGRLITTDPDLQRTPVKTPEGRRIRETFIAKEGHRLVSADWSQIELRLLAHFTDDTLLVESFNNNLDVHARTASQLFKCDVAEVTKKQRRVGKLVNFATIYGQGSTALGQILGVPKKEAQSYIAGYFEAYSGVRTWLDETMEAALECGFVTTLLGRRRYIPELSSNSFMIRQAGERIAANTPIQASAADICKVAMLNIAREMKARDMRATMLLQIHDELVFECPHDEVEELTSLVKSKMETVHPLNVPLVADVGVGANWSEAH
jgi:DNA polymerase-1